VPIVDATRDLPGRELGGADAASPAVPGARRIAGFAWFVVCYNIAVILWGAYVRATGSGAGCGSHWPLCNGEIVPTSGKLQTLIEFTHRVTSGLSIVLVFVLLVWCWRRTRKGDWPRRLAVSAAVLLLNEALLGAMLVVLDHVGFDRSAGRAVFLCLHFANTLLLVAALALTARWLARSHGRFTFAGTRREWLYIGFGLACVMVTGMTGTLAALGDTLFPTASLKASLEQDFASGSHLLLRLRLFHPATAAVALFYVWWMLRKLSKSPREFSATFSLLVTTLLVQVALGVLNVLLLAPVWLQITHLMVAEIFWILLVVASADVLVRERPAPLEAGG
jgi:cytochrome c oxidase assembly protein subunit 15